MSVDVFEGRPVEGEINRYTDGIKEQDDPKLFIEALDTLLAVPGVEAVRWNQYTPYFNDGEACVFSIYSAYVKVSGDEDEEAGDYGDGYRSTYDLYDYDHSKSGSYEDRQVFGTVGGYPAKMIHDALKAFESVLENGRHYVILNQKFGDPAQVTANRDGSFTVEFYEHD